MADKVVRKTGDGRSYWLLGGLYEVKASGDETNGEATIMEMTLPGGIGPPPHTHPGGEAVYVIEGTLRYNIAGETVEGGPGTLFYVPKDTLENFEPTSDCRLLVTYTPGGIDKFFEEAGEKAERHEVPPPSDEPPDLDRIVAVAEKYGMRMEIPQEAG